MKPSTAMNLNRAVAVRLELDEPTGPTRSIVSRSQRSISTTATCRPPDESSAEPTAGPAAKRRDSRVEATVEDTRRGPVADAVLGQVQQRSTSAGDRSSTAVALASGRAARLGEDLAEADPVAAWRGTATFGRAYQMVGTLLLWGITACCHLPSGHPVPEPCAVEVSYGGRSRLGTVASRGLDQRRVVAEVLRTRDTSTEQ